MICWLWWFVGWGWSVGVRRLISGSEDDLWWCWWSMEWGYFEVARMITIGHSDPHRSSYGASPVQTPVSASRCLVVAGDTRRVRWSCTPVPLQWCVCRAVPTHRGSVRKLKFAPGRGNMMLLVLYSDGTDVWNTHDVSRPFQNIAIVSCIDCYQPCKLLLHNKYIFGWISLHLNQRVHHISFHLEPSHYFSTVMFPLRWIFCFTTSFCNLIIIIKDNAFVAITKFLLYRLYQIFTVSS